MHAPSAAPWAALSSPCGLTQSHAGCTLARAGRLMDALAMRIGGGRTTSLGGVVLVNGAPRRAAAFLAASAYVPQARVRACKLCVRGCMHTTARVLRQRGLRDRHPRLSHSSTSTTHIGECTHTPTHPHTHTPTHPQHDNFVPTMTTAETVAFYAAVLLPPGAPLATRAARAESVLQLMGLAAQAGTLVSLWACMAACTVAPARMQAHAAPARPRRARW